jgi:hypothetical protein
LKSKR